MKLRCRFGWHNWTSWGMPKTKKMVCEGVLKKTYFGESGYSIPYEALFTERNCVDCGLVEQDNISHL